MIIEPTPELLAHLRRICLRLPEATEGAGVGRPTFCVRAKIFAMQHGHQGRPSLWCKAPPGAQELLIGADPARFFRPPYVGHHGWIGIRLDVPDLDWDEVAGLVEDSYRLTAPRRLAARLDQT